nr:hypothetical protein CFP56_19583 [Quercus suber]
MGVFTPRKALRSNPPSLAICWRQCKSDLSRRWLPVVLLVTESDFCMCLRFASLRSSSLNARRESRIVDNVSQKRVGERALSGRLVSDGVSRKPSLERTLFRQLRSPLSVTSEYSEEAEHLLGS